MSFEKYLEVIDYLEKLLGKRMDLITRNGVETIKIPYIKERNGNSMKGRFRDVGVVHRDFSRWNGFFSKKGRLEYLFFPLSPLNLRKILHAMLI